MRGHARLLAGLSFAALGTLTGCVPEGLAFRADDRVSITSPQDNSRTVLPVTLRWTVKDFDIVGQGTPPRPDAGYFVVFIDETPMPRGETVAWLARNDQECAARPGCPDATYLAGRDVYVTTETQLVLKELPESSNKRRERHTATIVLVDGAGTRLSENAFFVDFEVDREDQS